tara:strand:- start:10 stop:294 length:285 start_codon:yes stop_codon:yes gene_type:complete
MPAALLTTDADAFFMALRTAARYLGLSCGSALVDRYVKRAFPSLAELAFADAPYAREVVPLRYKEHPQEEGFVVVVVVAFPLFVSFVSFIDAAP